MAEGTSASRLRFFSAVAAASLVSGACCSLRFWSAAAAAVPAPPPSLAKARSAWLSHLRSLLAISSGGTTAPVCTSATLLRSRCSETTPLASRYGSSREASSKKRDALSDVMSIEASGANENCGASLDDAGWEALDGTGVFADDFEGAPAADDGVTLTGWAVGAATA